MAAPAGERYDRHPGIARGRSAGGATPDSSSVDRSAVKGIPLFGDLAAFMTGWTSFVAGFSGAIAAGALGLTVYFDRFVPGIANSKGIAVVIIALLAIVHMRGLCPGRVVQIALTLIKVGALFALVAGTQMAHIPYKGAAPATQELMAGGIQVRPLPNQSVRSAQRISSRSRSNIS